MISQLPSLSVLATVSGAFGITGFFAYRVLTLWHKYKPTQRYYKFTNKDCNHNEFQYNEGINTDTRPWNTTECAPGGLYIVPVEEWFKWVGYRNDLYYVWDAEPIGDCISHEPEHKTKCHTIRLWNRRPISEMKELQPPYQLMTVSQNGLVIRWISSPSKVVQFEAVQQNGKAIQYITNPSEEVQLAAVRQNGNAIEYITNPSEAAQLAAVLQNSGFISHSITSETAKLAAVRQNVRAFKYISNPSEEVQFMAVQQNGKAIQYITNPSEEVQLAAVRQDGNAIKYISDPSEEVQLAAQHIRN